MPSTASPPSYANAQKAMKVAKAGLASMAPRAPAPQPAVESTRTDKAPSRSPSPPVEPYADVAESVEDDWEVVENEGDVLDVNEFLKRFREHAAEYIYNAYSTEHTLHSSLLGTLTTSLAEDVFALVDVQISVLQDYLDAAGIRSTVTGSTVVALALRSMFRNLSTNQMHFRNRFLMDLELCCASANDFFRMTERMEAVVQRIITGPPAIPDDVRNQATELVALLGADAEYAALRIPYLILQTVQQSSIVDDLFHRDWEDRYTHNEVVLSLVKTYQDFMSDVQNYLAYDFLKHKVIAALVKTTICFYLRQLVIKADKIRRRRRRHGRRHKQKWKPFHNPPRALCRMMYDIYILRDYFQRVTKDKPTLERFVIKQFATLIIVQECLGLAIAGTSLESLDEFILVLHKSTGGNIHVTKFLLQDLWLLAAPAEQEHVIHDAVAMMQAELQMVSTRMSEQQASIAQKSSCDSGIVMELDEMLKGMYEDRMLQEQASLCAQCLHQPRSLRHDSLLSEKSSDQFLQGLQEKFAHKLNLQNLKAFTSKIGSPFDS